MLVAEVAATPLRTFLVEEGFGLATSLHAVPFQCSIRVWFALPLKEKPAAQALLAEVAATP